MIEEFTFLSRSVNKIKVSYKLVNAHVTDKDALDAHLKKTVSLLMTKEKEVSNGKILHEKDNKIIIEAYKDCAIKHPAHEPIALPEGLLDIEILKAQMSEIEPQKGLLNKKQLIVAWVMGVLVSIIAMAVNYTRPTRLGYLFDPTQLIRFGLPVIFIGSLLIYTLRGREKR